MLTYSVSFPWIIITSFICFLLWIKTFNYNIYHIMILSTFLFIVLLLGYNIKYIVKKLIKKPRPYIIWINEYNNNKNIKNNNLNFKNYNSIIDSKIIENNTTIIPECLSIYWKTNKKFSFPSGHTIFVSIITLTSIILLWPCKYFITTIIIFLWSICIMISRIVLGMHWPIDILVSIIISGILTVFCYFIIITYIHKKSLFIKHNK